MEKSVPVALSTRHIDTPDLQSGATEWQVDRVLKQSGDYVDADDSLFEVSSKYLNSDSSSMSIHAPTGGIVGPAQATRGQIVSAGEQLATILTVEPSEFRAAYVPYGHGWSVNMPAPGGTILRWHMHEKGRVSEGQPLVELSLGGGQAILLPSPLDGYIDHYTSEDSTLGAGQSLAIVLPPSRFYSPSHFEAPEQSVASPPTQPYDAHQESQENVEPSVRTRPLEPPPPRRHHVAVTEPVSSSEEDFTHESGLVRPGAPSPAAVKYDPSRDRERMRGWLGIAVVILIAVYALGITGLTAALVRPFDAQSLLSGVFTPLITVVGTVVGFYFGSSETRPK